MENSVQVGLRTRRVIKLSNVKTVGRKENPRLEILEKVSWGDNQLSLELENEVNIQKY